ncbi:MAG: hypothetical protein L6R36_007042 [Xanthoria steineri]|nr:MAG: hypothetical protein L6R36_007042 [Xanthoria steineri]
MTNVLDPSRIPAVAHAMFTVEEMDDPGLWEVIPGRRGLDMTDAAASSSSAGAVAGKAADDDVEDRHDAVEDGFEDVADAVDDGHDAGADGLEDRFDLLRGGMLARLLWLRGREDVGRPMGVGGGLGALGTEEAWLLELK